MASAPSDEISLLLQDVIDASQVPAKTRPTSIKPTVASLASLFFEHGLLPEQLSLVVDLLTQKNYLDQASLNSLARNLYPVSRVSSSVVVRVAAACGHGALKPSLTLQANLIKWLILVQHFLQVPSVLSQVYQIFFNLLDTAALRPNLCHLLALITRRRHVKLFRIQALLSLSRQTGNEPCLVGLLRVFKDYYPEIIVGDAVTGKASAFKHPDPQWRLRSDEIHASHTAALDENQTDARNSFRVSKHAHRTYRGGTVPLVHTTNANEDSVTLEEIEDAASFAKNLDRLELPNQLVAVLADPLLQKLLLLSPKNQSSYTRISSNLQSIFQDVKEEVCPESDLWELLDLVRDFAIQTNNLPEVVLYFFRDYLAYWDGQGARRAILDILQRCPVSPWDALYSEVFSNVECAVLDGSQVGYADILRMYNGLLHHWFVLIKSGSQMPTFVSKTLSSLMRHVNSLAFAAHTNDPTISTASVILDFYELSAQVLLDDDTANHARIEIPQPLLVYRLVFSSSGAILSRSCHVLACYKHSLERTMASDRTAYRREFISMYNGFLMDLVNCLWRNKGLLRDESSHGCYVPLTTSTALDGYLKSIDKSLPLGTVFSLTHSPVLCLQSSDCLRELEEEAMENDVIQSRHAGPATQASLTKLANAGGIQLNWHDYRIGVLRTLSSKELVGIAELLQSTMTKLKRSMDGERGASQALSSQ